MAGRQIALLRGINVGRAKRVAMADLRKLVEGLGYTDVRTLLNSGNVVFTAPRANPGDAADRIESALAAKLGVSARVTVITAAELATAIAENSLLDVAENPSRLMIAVLMNPADCEKLVPLSKQDWKPEAPAVGNRVIYYWCPGGIIESPVAAAVGKALGDGVTSRNWATILKLEAMTKK